MTDFSAKDSNDSACDWHECHQSKCPVEKPHWHVTKAEIPLPQKSQLFLNAKGQLTRQGPKIVLKPVGKHHIRNTSYKKWLKSQRSPEEAERVHKIHENYRKAFSKK